MKHLHPLFVFWQFLNDACVDDMTLPLLRRDETVSGYRYVRHFGKRKRGQWCSCRIDSVAAPQGLHSGFQSVWREGHCQERGSVAVLAGEAGWGQLEGFEIEKHGGQGLPRGQRL